MGVGFFTRPRLTAVNYMRMDANMFDEILNRVGIEAKREIPATSGKHLIQA